MRGERARPELERVLGAARKALPLARSVAAGVRTLALVSLGAGAVIVVSVLSRGLPDSGTDVVRLVLLAALVAAPGVVLLVFHFALGELLELPRRLRDLPREGREHAAALAGLERDVRERKRARGLRLPLAVWSLVSFLRGSGWILRPYAPVAAVFSPLMLLAVALSVLATVVLVLAALVALLAAAA